MEKNIPNFDWFLEKILEDRPSPHAHGEEELVLEAAKVIWSNISNPMDVGAIAGEVAVSRRTLERHFRRQFGRTVCEIVAVASLELAKWLLTETSLSILAVAMKAGYSSSDWMGKVVRRDTRSTPGEYRKQNNKEW